MTPIHRKLRDFWFEAAPPTRLAMLRILVGAYALSQLIPQQGSLLKIAQTDPRLFAPVGVVFGGPIGLELFDWLLRGTIVAGLCFTLGLWHRVTGPLFGGLQLWLLCYRNSWSMIYHSDNVLVLHTIVLGLTRSADAFSLDALVRHWRQSGAGATRQTTWQYGWPVKLMCALTVSSYFVTAVAKLAGPLGLAWMSGRALRSQMAVDGLRKELLGVAPNPVSYALYDWLPIFTLLAFGSMALEFLAPLALFNRRFGRIWAVNAFLMHWGILFVMRITFTYQITGVMFAPFFRVERLADFVRKLGWKLLRGDEADSEKQASDSRPVTKPLPSLPRATIYYDGECGLCDRFVQFVLRRDRREYFQFATLQSESGHEQLARLGLGDADLKTMVLVEADKSYVRSTAALRICRRLTGLWPLLYGLIFIPKGWRDQTYALVARNRKRWFKARSECPIMPPEWRRRFIN